MEELIREADLIVDACPASETVSPSNHAHDLEALDGGYRCLHLLEAASGLNDSLQRTMIRLDDVVQVFRRSILCACRKLTAALEPLDCFWIRAELVCGDR